MDEPLIQIRTGPASPQFCCPYCRSNMPPLVKQEQSQTGLILCILMLFLCFPLFWIGFLMKEDRRYCSACGAKWG